MNRREIMEKLCRIEPMYKDYYEEILYTFSTLELKLQKEEYTIQTILKEAKVEYDRWEK